MYSISLHFTLSFHPKPPSPSCQKRLQRLRLHTKRGARSAAHGHCALGPARTAPWGHACSWAHTWEGSRGTGLPERHSPFATPSWRRVGSKPGALHRSLAGRAPARPGEGLP